MKRSKGHRQTQRQAGAAALRPRFREGSLILMAAFSIFLWMAFLSYHQADPQLMNFHTAEIAVTNAAGSMGAWAADHFLYGFGLAAYIFPLSLTYLSWMLFRERHENKIQARSLWIVRGSGVILALLGLCALLNLAVLSKDTQVATLYRAGGLTGHALSHALLPLLSLPGSVIMWMAFFLAGVTLFSGLSWLKVTDQLGNWTCRGAAVLAHWGHGAWQVLKGVLGHVQTRWQVLREARDAKAELDASMEDAMPMVDDASSFERYEEPIAPTIAPSKAPETPAHRAPTIASPATAQVNLFELKADAHLPAIDLLDCAEVEAVAGYTHEELETISRDLEVHLRDFGVEVQVVAVQPGPVVTRFELQLAPGVKVSKITNLAKDIARSLSVTSVRIVDVIPGKSVIGLELPNRHREMVRLSEVIASQVYQQAKSPLTLALGKDIAGHPVTADIAKMPHLLVAGTTGSGKSVSINAMLLSLLYKATPADVRLILVDPKMLELSVYEGIPHLLAPVVTDMKQAANALRWCVAEMERRYRLMAALGVRNLAGFNDKVKRAEESGEALLDPLWAQEGEPAPELQTLPYIVVIIDEFADMMMVVGKKVEQLIARIAQKARAAGLHLVLATQRPSVDVITGLIKANIPARMAFQVSSKVDSRTVIDQQGAEQLLGHGDLLYVPPGTSVPIRVHGAFVDDDEVHRVVKDLKQRGEPSYDDQILHTETTGDPALGAGDDERETDELYDEAVAFILQSRRVSISSVQRRFKIGYNRAARLVEDMEAAGVVGPMESNGVREILVPQREETS